MSEPFVSEPGVVRGRWGSVPVTRGSGLRYWPPVVDVDDMQVAADPRRWRDFIATSKVIASQLAPMEAVCPGCLRDGMPEGKPRPILEAWQWVPHLNDDHHWSREQIADWLDSLAE